MTDDATFVTTALLVFTDMYIEDWSQPDALSWTPETIVAELQDDLGIKISSRMLDRIMTGIALLTTDDFYKRISFFITYCNILSGSDAMPGEFDPADAAECAWGITEAYLLEPPEEDSPFSEEICAYIGEVLKQEGILTPPDVLRIAGLPPANFGSMATDDPEQFAATYQRQQEASQDIVDALQEQLQALLGQLSSLKLEHGSTKDLLARVAGSI